jgi:alpha-tubulin suppressor-like RCC1 family protein
LFLNFRPISMLLFLLLFCAVVFYACLTNALISLQPKKKLAVGGVHTCNIQPDGKIYCFGSNSNGQLGDGSNLEALVPRRIPGITTAVDVCTGESHTCFLLSDGTTRCTGLNNFGQTGSGNLGTNSNSPVAVNSAVLGARVVCGVSHTCIIQATTGILFCFGKNDHGQLGTGNIVPNQLSSPTQIASGNVLLKIVDADCGLGHSCVVVEDGTYKCVGSNGYSQSNARGTVDTADVLNWSQAYIGDGGTPALQIVAGELFSCVLQYSMGVICFGKDFFSDGYLTQKTLKYHRFENFVFLAGGQSGVICATRNLALTTIACDGAVSIGSDITSLPSNVAEISVGKLSMCTLLVDGQVKCMGVGTSGQLGDGLNLTSTTDVFAIGLPASQAPTVLPTLLPTSLPTLLPSLSPTKAPSNSTTSAAGNSELNEGVIFGISVGACAGVLFIFFVIFLCGCLKNIRNSEREET